MLATVWFPTTEYINLIAFCKLTDFITTKDVTSGDGKERFFSGKGEVDEESEPGVLARVVDTHSFESVSVYFKLYFISIQIITIH